MQDKQDMKKIFVNDSIEIPKRNSQIKTNMVSHLIRTKGMAS